MHLSCARHLGGTMTAGSTASGTIYASHSERQAHTYCWMRLAVFEDFPEVLSLAGTMVQRRKDLLLSTRGAGKPVRTALLLEFELFDDEAPRTCANFRRLCSGHSASRMGQTYCFQALTPSYRGTVFHKIVPKYFAQGGDITMRVDGGANHMSSAGRGWFADESKKRRHNEEGLLSMANNGPNSNGSQFFITTSADKEQVYNGRHVCFGRVVRGLEEFLQEVAPYGDVQGRPSRYVVVEDCGAGTAPVQDDSAAFEGACCEFTDGEEQEDKTLQNSHGPIRSEPSVEGRHVETESGQAASLTETHAATETITTSVPTGEMTGVPPLPLKSSIKKDMTSTAKRVTYAL